NEICKEMRQIIVETNIRPNMDVVCFKSTLIKKLVLHYEFKYSDGKNGDKANENCKDPHIAIRDFVLFQCAGRKSGSDDSGVIDHSTVPTTTSTQTIMSDFTSLSLEKHLLLPWVVLNKYSQIRHIAIGYVHIVPNNNVDNKNNVCISVSLQLCDTWSQSYAFRNNIFMSVVPKFLLFLFPHASTLIKHPLNAFTPSHASVSCSKIHDLKHLYFLSKPLSNILIP
ncbi:hypothetical protein RFI_24669, partial [Reticulomyxa filosa]